MCQCNCSKSTGCSCTCKCSNQKSSNRKNSIRHTSIITSPINSSNKNNCCCGARQPANCTGSNFCFLKSYLEDVLGWENVVKPCSNYGRRTNIFQDQLRDLTKGKGSQNILDVIESIIEKEDLEKLKDLTEFSDDYNIKEFIKNSLKLDLSDLEETVFV